MTRRRWIADEVHENTAFLTAEHASHLSRVLRAQIGQEFDIATGDAVRLGTITSISDDRVEFALGSEVTVKVSAKLTLVLAIFKFDRMEWAIEKCTEIGVARIIPLIARRTDAHLAAAAAKRHERWLRIARQAAEQSRRPSPPEISVPVKLKELGSAGVPPATKLEDGKAAAGAKECIPRIVLSESENNTTLRDALPLSASEAVLAVGPEGGWTDEELSWFRESGWTTASLGETILRAETAAIVASALAVEILS
jgi:16S rRNA (uracil1498-N3)-methyltransferase